MICPKCGNSDPTKILWDVSRTLVRGAVLHGWECADCGERWRRGDPLDPPFWPDAKATESAA